MTQADISIIIPVLNETGTINATLTCLQQQSTETRLEVVIVDADPAGTTLKAIHITPSSRFVLKTDRTARGRGLQMNRGAEIATAAIILFLHADTLLPEGAFEAAISTLQDPQIVGGAFDLGIRSSKWGYRVIETVGSLRSRLTRLPYGDQAIFLRRDYFHDIGGFSMIPIMEDVDLMQRIKNQGDRIAIIDRQVLTDPRRWEKEGFVYGTLRNWVLMILYLMGVSPHKLVKYYR
jgi:rSAM/selenodomain-associated transferase 2